MLRLILGLLPALATTALFPKGKDEENETEDEEEEDDEDDSGGKTFTQKDVDRIVRQRLNRERGSLREEVEADVRKQLESDAQKKKAEDEGEYKPLYDKAKDEITALKNEISELKSQVNHEKVRGRVMLEAGRLNFVDPNDVWGFINMDDVEYDDAGEPTNVQEILGDLSKTKPYLVKTGAGDDDTSESTSNGTKKKKVEPVESTQATSDGKFSKDAEVEKLVTQGRRHLGIRR